LPGARDIYVTSGIACIACPRASTWSGDEDEEGSLAGSQPIDSCKNVKMMTQDPPCQTQGGSGSPCAMRPRALEESGLMDVQETFGSSVMRNGRRVPTVAALVDHAEKSEGEGRQTAGSNMGGNDLCAVAAPFRFHVSFLRAGKDAGLLRKATLGTLCCTLVDNLWNPRAR
jgi:hypothetical protein